jgi:UPF0755 protein
MKKALKKFISGKITKIIALFFSALIIILLWIFFLPNFKTDDDKANLYIYPDDSFENVVGHLKETNSIQSSLSFIIASKIIGYELKIHPGRYIIRNNMNNFSLLRKLRSGRQDPVKMKINNLRTKEQLAGKLSAYLMADSASIIKLLNDTAFLAAYELNPNTSVSVFIPNTYEVFWDTNAEGIFERMLKESKLFWTEERKAKAAAIPMTQIEVLTLASIIEEETNNKKEHPIIAGLYINRLKTGMPLQACPTIRFALNDFTIKRVLLVHTRFKSPYNTYKNKGLPPGPIRIPSINCIDAVLNYQKHNFLFMCAKETLNGEHNFAVTGEEHMENARKYQKALDERGIK